MRLTIALVVVAVIVAVVIVVVIMMKSNVQRQAALSAASKQSARSSDSQSISKSPLVHGFPRSNPVRNALADLNLQGLSGPPSKYAIALPPALEEYRSKIFKLHIEDIRVSEDLKTDSNYPKVIKALQTYGRAPTVEELRFLIKYKHFLDMPGVYSMCGPREIDQLYLVILNVIANKVPGDFIETGVWKGGMGLYAKAIFNHYSSSSTSSTNNRIVDHLPRRVLLFDAFDQFPDPEPVNDPSTGQWSINEKDSGIHQITRMMYDQPATAVGVRDAFQTFGLLDDNVSIVKGLFSKTIPAAFNSGLISSSDSIAVLRIDNDYFDSVYLVLNQLYHRISPGGYVILDDFNNPVIGCKEAVLRFRQENNITIPIIDTYGGSVYWQV